MQAPAVAAHGTAAPRQIGTAAPRQIGTAAPRQIGSAAPFVLSRPHGTVVAEGVDARFDSAGEAAAALRAGSVAAVVGALPFAPDHHAALTAPVALRHQPDPVGDVTVALPPVRIAATLPTEDEHLDRVATALRQLRDPADDLAKVVLARALLLRADAPVDPASLLARLAGNDPSGNGFVVDLTAAGGPWTGRHLVGASPEVLVRRRGDLVTCHPLAGSAPRHPDPEVDRRTGRRLAASEKNLAEHAHVVDALRASLEPLCTDLDIPGSPTLTTTRQLWHLGTPISGRLRDRSVTALDLALAVHPTPAICGTPTAPARALIQELEGDRGFYAGAVGWADRDGDGEWMVTIRCAVLDADGTTLTTHAGGGIVAGSDPLDELAETTTKFGTVLEALGVRR
ncbi:isochorismate synthase [Rhodococcus aetherivorans]|uniref:isochorismate synthase n=2 Tax=Rhodococcus TaxID=1827 RepID=UPI0002D247AD|nr:isochorismate synthase [Rhodococcus aetherivorans]CCW10065.1 Isochorismate synthase [Rhodococcus aetherivorans]